MTGNILLLMTDQHRPDYVGYGGAKVPTPNIDRIARGAAFMNCVSVNPICTPMRASLFTGKYSRQIGMLDMSGDLHPSHPTFMRALQRAGYHTSAVGKLHILQTWPWSAAPGKGLDLVRAKDAMKRYGFDEIWQTAGKQQTRRNFCDYSEHLRRKGLLDGYLAFMEKQGPNASYPKDNPEHKGGWNPLPDEDYIDRVTADKIIERIKRRPKDRPFFIFGSFCGPHKPFDPPKAYFDRVPYDETDDFIPGEAALSPEDKKLLYGQRRAYKAMVMFLDDMIGMILDALEADGLLDQTLVAFTSDHGEMLGDYGMIQKSHWHRHSVSVPLAIRHPGHLTASRLTRPVETNDLTATVLEFAGLDPQAALSQPWPAYHNIVPCRSLLPVIRGEADGARGAAFSECANKWQMVQDERYKYVRELGCAAPGERRERLYDLEGDPGERRDLSADAGARAALKRLRDYRDFILDATPPAQTRWAEEYLRGE